MIVVDSPPGMTSPSRPSSCSGSRTSTRPPPEPPQHRHVLAQVPLDSQDTDLHGLIIAIRSRVAEHVGRERLDAVEEEDPLQMVELVQEAARLEPHARDARASPVGVVPSTRTLVARRTFAVNSGTLRQPSRATSLPDASSTVGFASTTRPLPSAARGWSVTSTTRTRTSSPTCGAASPTQRLCARIVSTRSRASDSKSRSSGPSSGRQRCFSASCGTRRTARTPRARLEHVALERAHRHLDPLLRAHARERRLHVDVPRGELELHHVERPVVLPGEDARREIRDVHLARGERVGDRVDDADVVGAVDGDDVRGLDGRRVELARSRSASALPARAGGPPPPNPASALRRRRPPAPRGSAPS